MLHGGTETVASSLLVYVLSDEIRCLCPEIPPVNLTEPPPRDCFEVGARYRYRCKAGHKREAGTSDLIKCVQTAHAVEWTSHNLRCKCKLGLFTHPGAQIVGRSKKREIQRLLEPNSC